MIENLQNELYQLENIQAKGDELGAKYYIGAGEWKMFQLSPKYFVRGIRAKLILN